MIQFVLLAFLLHSTIAWRIEQHHPLQIPPNTQGPDYFHPSAVGGNAYKQGKDGAAVIVSKLFSKSMDEPLELRANFFFVNNVLQEYEIPGDRFSEPYDQVVTIKVWGAGGGGCGGGESFYRGNTLADCSYLNALLQQYNRERRGN